MITLLCHIGAFTPLRVRLEAGGQARGQAINGHANSVPEQFLLCLQPKALQ